MAERDWAQHLLTRRRLLRGGAGMSTLGLALSLGACGITGPAYGPESPEVAQIVEMTIGLDFIPVRIAVYEGDVVEWRNTSPFTHTVTADPALAENPENVRLPPGAAPFHSGNVPPGEIFRHTFTVSGTYRYFCVPHQGSGMVGTVLVSPRT